MSVVDVNLGFKLLDDLALGVEQECVNASALSGIRVNRLGPIVEVISLASEWRQKELAKLDWLCKGDFESMFLDARSLQTRTQQTGTLTGWIAADQFADDTFWTGFVMRVSAAINSSEFDGRTKKAIMATFGEFRSNVFEHADVKGAALAAFHVNGSGFELTVADQGRGVLASIRENQNYKTESIDAGHALKLAVTDGVSRHDNSQRGYGFTHLFKGLANRFNHIRLRSDDYALEVFRENESAPRERISQKAHIPGLFVYAQIGRAS